jgi:hypothetical protein
MAFEIKPQAGIVEDDKPNNLDYILWGVCKSHVVEQDSDGQGQTMRLSNILLLLKQQCRGSRTIF